MRKFLPLILFALLLILGPARALAATYGEGSYGGGEFNVGEVADSPTPTPSTSPTSTSSSNGSTSSSDNSSGVSTPSCNDQPPGSKAPWLYGAVARSATSVEIYFTDADEPYDHYVLEYGTAPGNYQWGATNIGGKGTRTYVVSWLIPNKTYYFRVRAGNGCATGTWSNELTATTKGWLSVFATDSLDTESIDAEMTRKDVDAKVEQTGASGENVDTDQGKDGETNEEDRVNEDDQVVVEKDGYNVKIKVIDENNEAVLGASVTLHSTPRETETNEDGIAYYEDVEPGEHRVVVAFNGQTGEQKINIPRDSDVEEISFVIQMKTTNPFLNPWVISVIGSLLLVLIVTLILLLRKRARR